MRLVVILLFAISSVCFPQEFWQQMDFPSFFNGEIASISSINGLVMASTYMDGSAISTNSGESWSPTTLPNSIFPVHISMSRYIFSISNEDGSLYRSKDSGNTWNRIGSLVFYNPSFASSPNGYIYIGSFQGVYRSTDSGESWTEQDNGLTLGGTSPFVHIAVSSNGILAAASPSGVFSSTNNGDSWQRVSSMGSYTVAVNSSGHIFATKYREEPYYYSDTLFITTDNGASWKALNEQMVRTIFINPLDDKIVVLENGDVPYYSLSTDNGSTWKVINTDGIVSDISYNGSDTYYLGVQHIGMLKSSSLAGPWQLINNGFPGTSSQISSLLSKDGTVFAGTKSKGLFSSSENGTVFNRVPTSISATFPVNKLRGTTSGSIFAIAGISLLRSNDNGLTWFSYNADPGLMYNFDSYCIATTGNIVLAGGQQYLGNVEIEQSTDNGNSWGNVFSSSYSGYPNKDFINAIAVNQDGTALACSEHVKVPTRLGERYEYTFGILRSTDFGKTWSKVTTDLPSVPEIRDFVWNSSDEIFAATSKGILYSTDNGVSWSQSIGAQPPALDVLCIAINSNNDIYIGTSGAGIFLSTDNGSTWNPMNSGMTDTTINAIIITPSGTLYAGTEHNGIFRSLTSTTLVENKGGFLPGNHQLKQNYPNPFNPSTTISYQIPKAEFVSLKVFDMLGKEIASLVDEEKSAGSYNVEFNGSSLSSGVYFYRLQSGSFVETKKLILMK